MGEYVIQIDFVDCPGLGFEIFKIIEHHRIDKIAMEVLPQQGMIIKFRCDSMEGAVLLVKDLRQVSGITAIHFRDQMPYEDREHELRTIIDSTSEGMIAVNRRGRITHINDIACAIFFCSGQTIIGTDVTCLLGPDTPLMDTLQTGRAYKLKEQKLKRSGQTLHFLISCKAVKNAGGQIIGAVSTFQDVRQVENILSKVDKIRRVTTFEDIVYQSPKMHSLIAAARTVAKSSSTILLRGESGTGKELFAKAIHADGPRYKAPFIAVNCTALTDSLLESELFGYENGAFTGAAQGGKKGLFEQANGGTLLLDEIGEISPSLQVKLLRVLQEGVIRKIGGEKELPVDVRIIAATHRNLEKLLGQGQFREDLYYRLNVIPLMIPPLRERREDIPLLVQRLIRKICLKLEKLEIRLAKESMDIFMIQQWPGNVRQLENTLERLINLVDAPEILPDHILAWTDLREGGQNGCIRLPEESDMLQFNFAVKDSWPSLKQIVDRVEKEVIRKVLKQYPSSRMAGQILGVSNTTILNKMKK